MLPSHHLRDHCRNAGSRRYPPDFSNCRAHHRPARTSGRGESFHCIARDAHANLAVDVRSRASCGNGPSGSGSCPASRDRSCPPTSLQCTCTSCSSTSQRHPSLRRPLHWLRQLPEPAPVDCCWHRCCRHLPALVEPRAATKISLLFSFSYFKRSLGNVNEYHTAIPCHASHE